jgi:uncharacterized protein with von Willebrand factor type A (vWA) domain
VAPEPTPDAIGAVAVAFVDTLRAEGLEVPLGSTLVYVRALAEIDPASRSEMYWTGHATLVRRAEDTVVYDRVFARFWQHASERVQVAVTTASATLAVEDPTSDPSDDGREDDDVPPSPPSPVLRASRVEVLRDKDFAACTDEELEQTRRLMDDLRFTAARRRSRRLHRVPLRHTRGARPDVRATMRRSVRAGGEVVVPSRRGPSERPRNLVLLLDVSGSMDAYARALIRFAHAAVASRRNGRVEAFALGTRLTRLTRALSSHDADAALAAAAAAVADWSGGTRLGEGLRTFNDEWGVRGLARGAVIVILSDGWDRGDPSELAEQMARLHRVARRVVWVNPLKATEGYEPLARGMAAALPYIDDFVEGHSLAALEELATTVAQA